MKSVLMTHTLILMLLFLLQMRMTGMSFRTDPCKGLADHYMMTAGHGILFVVSSLPLPRLRSLLLMRLSLSLLTWMQHMRSHSVTGPGMRGMNHWLIPESGGKSSNMCPTGELVRPLCQARCMIRKNETEKSLMSESHADLKTERK
jgi:hypothetical protein